MGIATSERADSLSYGASSFVRMERSNGESFPLEGDLEVFKLGNVAVDGGAVDDSVSNVQDITSCNSQGEDFSWWHHSTVEKQAIRNPS